MHKLLVFVAVIALAVGIDLLALLSLEDQVHFQLWPLSGSVALEPMYAVLLGLVLGLSFVPFAVYLPPWAHKPRPPADGPIQADGDAFPAARAAGLAVAITTGALLLVAVRLGKLDPVAAALAYFLGSLAAIAMLHAVRGLARGDVIAFDSHWGGFGGAQGGWRLSPLTTSLLLALVLVGGTVAVASGQVRSDHQAPDGSSADGKKAGDNAAPEPAGSSGNTGQGKAAGGTPAAADEQ